MVGVLWAYDGWVNLTPLAEEVRDPGRNVPLAMIAGMGVLIALYLALTLAYHWVLPLDEVVAATRGRPQGRERDRRHVLRAAAGPAGGRGDLAAGDVLDVHLAQRQRPDRPAGLLRHGPRPAVPGGARPDPSRGSRRPPTPILAQGIWAILLTVAATTLILVPVPGAGSGDRPARARPGRLGQAQPDAAL